MQNMKISLYQSTWYHIQKIVSSIVTAISLPILEMKEILMYTPSDSLNPYLNFFLSNVAY